MTGFDDPAFFGDRWASVYGEGDEGSEPVAEAEFLARLGRDGRVLELAIGTGLRPRRHAIAAVIFAVQLAERD